MLVYNGSKGIIRNPTLIQVQEAQSVHVFAFDSFKELLIAESEGDFSMADWEELYRVAENLCCGSHGDDPMQEEEQSMQQFIQNALREKVADDLRWKVR